MSDEWYYAAAGQQHGPVSGDALRNLVAAGHIGGNDLAWRDGLTKWTAVSLLPELLTRATAPPAEYDTATRHDAAPTANLAPGVQLAYGGYQSYATSDGPLAGVEYGGFWIRVGAYVIDALILFIPNKIIELATNSITGFTPGRGAPSLSQLLLVLSLSFLPLILDWLYFSFMESSANQATLGKMACGLIVTDAQGRRLTFGRATGRYFAKVLSALILCIGFIMVGTDPRKRGLHDQIARTFVVKKKSLRPTF